MRSNKLHGYWDRCRGFGREFWGEIAGNEQLYEDGLRQRMIGRIESYQDLSRKDAEQQLDRLA